MPERCPPRHPSLHRLELLEEDDPLECFLDDRVRRRCSTGDAHPRWSVEREEITRGDHLAIDCPVRDRVVLLDA